MTVLVAHDHHALAAATAGDKGNLRHVGNDRNGVRTVEQTVRNECIGSRAQLLQNLSGHQQVAFFACRLGVQLGCARDESDACEQAYESDAVAHHENPLVVVAVRRRQWTLRRERSRKLNSLAAPKSEVEGVVKLNDV